MPESQRKRLLITDLDNTLWDWFDAWYRSFSIMLSSLTQLSGVSAAELEAQIRLVHQLRGTTEYSNLLRELPALKLAASPKDPADAFHQAIRLQRFERKSATRLYPGVLDTLTRLKSAGVQVVAYTESIAYWSAWRIKHTRLDGIIDVLYSAPDHDLPDGVTFQRNRPQAEYGLKLTEHRHVPRGLVKPNTEVLLSILESQGCDATAAFYVGDSLMKDVAMAQRAGVSDAFAKYGTVQRRPEYELLRRVSHWTDEDVECERESIEGTGDIIPSFTCDRAFDQIIPFFGLG